MHLKHVIDVFFLFLASVSLSERNHFNYFGRGSPKQHSMKFK